MPIYTNILDFYDNYSRKRIKKSEYDYTTHFNNAIENTKELNLDVPDFKFDNQFKSFENETARNDIRNTIHNAVYKNQQELLALNCFYFAERAQISLKRELNINSVLTLGSFSDDGTKMFYESLKKLKYRLKHKEFVTNGINLHAWLTLPDYRIIDVTILSALKLFGKFPEIDYRNFYYLNSLNQNGNNGGFSYHPIFIGNDYLKKINLKPKLIGLVN